MSNDEPDSPKPAAEPAAPKPEQPAEPTPQPDNSGPASRDEALHRLRGDAAELASDRFGKIASEGISRLSGVGTVNIFHGDFAVEGDFMAGGPGRRASARRSAKIRLDPEDLAEQIEYFVEPPGFDVCVSMLADINLVVFSGQGRTGRYTRAIGTLHEVLRQAGRPPVIYRLASSVLRSMSWRVPEPGCGLVIVDEPGKNDKFEAEAVTDEWLTRAAKLLADNECYLVVVTGPLHGSLASASKRPEFVLEDLEPPDPLQIVLARIRGEAPGAAADLEQTLIEAGLADLLAERDDPQFAVRAAMTVITGLREGITVADVVAKLSNPEDQVREWLDGEPDLAEVALVIATAVLEGATYLSVADAAIALYRQISSSSAVLTPRYLRGLLAERDWIQPIHPEDRPTTTPLLQFKHPRLRPVVLAVTWFELDGARAKILAWLKALAEHSDVEVRARAAQSAGILANSDFEHGVHRYLMPWGMARSAPLRQSAAYGLNVATTFGDHTESAWAYIEQWADLVHSGGNIRNLPSTAGLAAGGPLGVENPGRALRVLRTLVESDNWALLEPVAVSTRTLLEADRGEEVMSALLEWTEAGTDDETLVKALTMFAYAVSSEDELAGEHPLLMRTAEKHEDALAELWGRSLANESVNVLASDALESWVRTVDQDNSMRDLVLGVIAGIADRSDTDFQRLLHTLRGWALDADHPSDTAADFYNVLLEAEEEDPS